MDAQGYDAEYEAEVMKMTRQFRMSEEDVEIFKLASRIETGFRLNEAEMIRLCGHVLHNDKVLKLEEIRVELWRFLQDFALEISLRNLLFTPSDGVKDSYYNLIIAGRFDDVLADIKSRREDQAKVYKILE